MTHINDGLLAFDGNFQRCPCELDDEVSSFEVAGNRSSQIEISNRLRPFIRQLRLLCVLFGLSLCVLLLFF